MGYQKDNLLHCEEFLDVLEPQDQDDFYKGALALYYIQQDLDESIFIKVATPTTTKEAWEILKITFNLRRATSINNYLSHKALMTLQE